MDGAKGGRAKGAPAHAHARTDAYDVLQRGLAVDAVAQHGLQAGSEVCDPGLQSTRAIGAPSMTHTDVLRRNSGCVGAPDLRLEGLRAKGCRCPTAFYMRATIRVYIYIYIYI